MIIFHIDIRELHYFKNWFYDHCKLVRYLKVMVQVFDFFCCVLLSGSGNTDDVQGNDVYCGAVLCAAGNIIRRETLDLQSR